MSQDFFLPHYEDVLVLSLVVLNYVLFLTHLAVRREPRNKQGEPALFSLLTLQILSYVFGIFFSNHLCIQNKAFHLYTFQYIDKKHNSRLVIVWG